MRCSVISLDAHPASNAQPPMASVVKTAFRLNEEKVFDMAFTW